MPAYPEMYMEHELKVDKSFKSIKQKKRNFHPKRQKPIKEEVDKLLAANFIKECKYSEWLSNVVMVKKNNVQWRMCIDFTDLNAACPKDKLPLPKIDF